MHRHLARLTGLLTAVAFAATIAVPAVAAERQPSNRPDTSAATVPLGAQLAGVRAATARFHDVAVAEAAGYEQVSPCIQRPDGAAMGAHWVRVDLIDDQLVPEEPEALLYLPHRDGRLRLVGVEYLSTSAEGTLFGQHLHAGPAGAALHAWVWQANPEGMFADFNPNLSC